MKVLRTTATFFPHMTGPAYQAYRISKGLTERGHESPIITSDYTPDEEMAGYPPEMDPDESFPFEVTRRRTLFRVHQYRMPPTATFDFFRREFDLIHCHGYHNAIKDLFYLCNRVDTHPFVIHGHGSFSKHKDPTIETTTHFQLYNILWKRTVDNADAVVVSTEAERADAVEFGVDREKLHVVPVGKDPTAYTAVERDPPTDHFRLLFVGRLAPRRNLELLLQALRRIRTDYSEHAEEIELHVVGDEDKLSQASGDSYLETLRELAADLDVASMVQFCGPKYGDDLIAAYRSAHVFVTPTHFENFGQTALEAAFAGLPVITTDTGVGPELVDRSDGGFVVTDERNLTEAIITLMTDRDRCRAQGERMQDLAKAEYTWNNIVDKYQRIYRTVLEDA